MRCRFRFYMPAQCLITGRTNGAPATLEDYRNLFQVCNRPHKFSSDEVGFIVNSPGPRFCEGCRHWFVNPASTRFVCEIMRRPNEAPIPGAAVCRFWNVD